VEIAPQRQATIVVQFLGVNYCAWFKVRVFVDGWSVGMLSDAGARSILVDAGTHRVSADVGSLRSRKLVLSLEPGDRVVLECGYRRPVFPHFGISVAAGAVFVFLLFGLFRLGIVVQALGVFTALADTVAHFVVPGSSFYLRRRAAPLDADANPQPIDVPIGQAAAARRAGLQMNLKGLLIAIVCCAPLFWVGRELWDHRPANQPARAARLLRSEDSNDRYDAASNLQLLLQFRTLTPEQLHEAIPGLLAVQSDREPRVREAAADCLFTIVFQAMQRGAAVPHVQEVAAGLAEGLVDTLPKVRHDSGLALANIYFGTFMQPLPSNTERFVDLLCHALEDPERENREWARQVLRSIAPRLKQPAPGRLLKLLHATDADTRAHAFKAVVAFSNGIDASLPDLMAALEHEADPGVRRARSLALVGVRPSISSLPVLRRALASPVRVVRFRAADLISSLGPRACEAIPSILPLLQETFVPETAPERKQPEWNDPAVAATWALGAIAPGTPMAVLARASLSEMLRQPGHPWRRADGNWALGRLNPAATLEEANASAPSQ
jgi:hypothetical protein